MRLGPKPVQLVLRGSEPDYTPDVLGPESVLLFVAASLGVLIALPFAAVLGRLVLAVIPIQAIGKPIVVDALRLTVLSTLLTVERCCRPSSTPR